MSGAPAAGFGHRLVPHVADVVLEAWGPTRVACLEEAVRALVESFADVEAVEAVGAIGRVPVTLDATGDEAGCDEDALVLLLEEVVYVVEVLGEIPVRMSLEEHERGAVSGYFETVPSEQLESIGALPKGVSRSGLQFGPHDGQWRCRVIVDV